MKEEEIPTPALVIDIEQVKRNLRRMADYADKHGLNLRPHTKTHKSMRMAKLQLKVGAIGLTVAKAGEARVMAEVCDDIMVGYPALDRPRTETIAEVAKKATVRVAVDSTLAVDRLGQAARAVGVTIGILPDLDTGVHRTGVQTPEESLELAQQADATDGLRLDGLFCYQGNIRGTQEQVKPTLAETSAKLSETLDLWKKNGLAAEIVSGGNTPGAFFMHEIPQLNEIRPGTCIYYDRNCMQTCCCTVDDCAARFVATVVSTAVPGKMVLDAGGKTLAADRLYGTPDTGGHGLIVEYPDALIETLTEEHGTTDITKCDHPPKLGDRVHVIPNHICVCVNLQNHIWVKDVDGNVEKIPVDARGMLS